jgi:hypothetical protein
MNKEDITRMAREAGFVGFDGDNGSLRRFAYLVEKHAYEKQLELPEPRLTGKFSITMGKFKCTGCTGLWDSREDAKHHSCRDYQ